MARLRAGAILFRALAEGRGTICSEDVWDEHALHEQRETNILCWLYGYDPFTVTFIPASFPEATGRLQRCGPEYQQTETAWETLLTPHSNTEPEGQGLGYSHQGHPLAASRGRDEHRGRSWSRGSLLAMQFAKVSDLPAAELAERDEIAQRSVELWEQENKWRPVIVELERRDVCDVPHPLLGRGPVNEGYCSFEYMRVTLRRWRCWTWRTPVMNLASTGQPQSAAPGFPTAPWAPAPLCPVVQPPRPAAGQRHSRQPWSSQPHQPATQPGSRDTAPPLPGTRPR